MKKLYVYNGNVPGFPALETEQARIGKGLERVIENAVFEAKVEYAKSMLEAGKAIFAELKVPDFESKQTEVEKAIDAFLDENVTAENHWPAEYETEEFWELTVLRDIYGLELMDEDDLSCFECIGSGRIYNNADETSGQWCECEHCHGTGMLTPEQLEAELSHNTETT